MRRVLALTAVGMLLAVTTSGAFADDRTDAGSPTVLGSSAARGQAFVTFRSITGGYELQVPQGWARTTRGPDVRFASALDGVEVTVTSAPTAPTAAGARTRVVVALEKSGRSVHLTKEQNMYLLAGAAVLVESTSASTPDPATSKPLRLQNDTYLFSQHGKLATLTLWAPLGANNNDQWGRMARSFRWL